MSDHLIRHPDGFGSGLSAITRRGEPLDTGIDFGILKLAAGERLELRSDLESAYLLMDGHISFQLGTESRTVKRSSLFEQDPTALHLAAGTEASLECISACELAVCQTENQAAFAPTIFDSSNMLESEHRGQGLLDDTAYRIVRTIFDKRNREEANLVLGEVVNFPGRWSSYPPHHHPQPEIYHYRFTEEQGYGHGELGDDVLKIRQFDTLKILAEKDHSQVAAPGYGMYYLWVIRHLPEVPYTVPDFTAEHSWTMEPDSSNRAWKPRPSVDDREKA